MNDKEYEKFLLEGLSASLAFKNGKKNAIDAIIASKIRHRAQNESRNKQNSLVDRLKYRDIERRADDEKLKNLEDLVDNSKLSDKIVVDLRDDDTGKFLNTRSLTADFDKIGHMSLHVIKGMSRKLEDDIDGGVHSTGYGENNVFFKNATGKSLNSVVNDKFNAEKKRVGLLEALMQQKDINTESLFKMWEERFYAIQCLSSDSRNIVLNAVAAEYFGEFDEDKDHIPEIGPGQKYHKAAIRKFLRDIKKLKEECIESLYNKKNIAISEYVLDALRELDNKGYIDELKKEFDKPLTEAHRDDPEVIELANEIKADVKRLNDLGINTGPVDHLDLDYIPEKKLNESEILDERLETLLSRPKDFFNKEIHLYRGSRELYKDMIVKPTFLNNGTKISPARASSFWSDDKETAEGFLFINSYNQAIDKYCKEHNLKYENLPVSSRKTLVYIENGDIEDIKKYILNLKLSERYLYEVTIKGSDPDLGIGRNRHIKEFTIDREIKADKVTKYTRIPKEFLDSTVFFTTSKTEYESKKKEFANSDDASIGKMELFLKKSQSPLDPMVALKTEFFLNEFIDCINKKKYSNVVISADRHIGKSIPNSNNNTNLIKVMKEAEEFGKEIHKLAKESKAEFILFLGDIVDKRWINQYRNIMSAFYSGLEFWCKVIYILGNSEVQGMDPKDIMKDSLFRNNKGVFWAGYKIETDKFIFSHAPVEIPDGDKRINIHAHIHGHDEYWVNPKHHIQIWREAPEGKPVLLSTLLKDQPVTDKNNFKLDNPPKIKEMDKPMAKLYKNYSLAESEFSDDLHSIYGNLPEIENIKDVLNDIKDIRYGFINKQNGEEILDRDWIHGCKNLGDYYSPETDPTKTIERKLGICQDQSLATQYLFKKYHPELQTQLYALVMPPFGHCVFCFMDDSKWYHLENSWNKERGLHGPFMSRQELENHLRAIYNKHHGLDTDAKPEVIKFEDYQRMRQGLNESVSEEIRFI